METKQNLQKCINCKKEMPANSKKCPSCGANQTVVFVILIIMIIFFISTMFFIRQPNDNFSSSPSSPEEYFYKNSSTAKMMCRDGIKIQLKAPSTAKFELNNVLYTGAEGAEATVSGYVDAQNSFGAMIRTNLDCKFKWNGSDFQLKEANLHY